MASTAQASNGTGGSAAGGSSNTGTFGPVNPVPAPGDSWSFPSGDSLNSTPPELARLGDGVVIAGGTQDPELAGLTEFDDGITAEAFVARLGHDGARVWSQPLLAAGLPWAMDVDTDGNTVVLAPYLPDASYTMPSTYADSMYLAKVDAAGELVFEKELAFEDGRLGYALTLGNDGSIFIAGRSAKRPTRRRRAATGRAIRWIPAIRAKPYAKHCSMSRRAPTGSW
jgi:hypothetical protein